MSGDFNTAKLALTGSVLCRCATLPISRKIFVATL
ncbi:Uncharacterised protein [Vibrio cholerae]|nr:Uncharacterised protein [Vibrio cholerae]